MAPSAGLIEKLKGTVASIGQRAVSDVLSSYADVMHSLYVSGRNSSGSSRFSNMRDTDYEEMINKARSSIALGNTQGLAIATKFASDAYMYGTIPAMQMAGSAAGKYGYIITSYLQTKEQFKQEYKMMGMQVGAMAGGALGNFLSGFVGNGLIRSGMLTLGGAGLAAATGAGIVAALPAAALGLLQLAAGYLLKLIVGSASTAGGAYVGSKVGEKIGDAYGEKYSDINLGQSMMSMTYDTVDAWKSSLPYLVSRGGSVSYDNLLPIAEKLDRGAGMDLNMFFSDNISKLSYASNFSMKYGGSDLEGVAGYSAMLDNVSGTDMSTSVAAYAKINRNPKEEVDLLSKSVEMFLGASVGDGEVTKSSFEVAKFLMEYSGQYSTQRVTSIDDTSKTFASMYNFVNQVNTDSAKANTLHVNSTMGAIDTIFDEIIAGSRMGERISSNYNIDYRDIVGGAASNPKAINTLLTGLSEDYGLQNLKITKDGELKTPDKFTEQSLTNAMMIFRGGRSRGGMGLGHEGTNEIIRAIAIMNTFGKIDFNSKLLREKGQKGLNSLKNGISREDAFRMYADSVETTNKLLDASTKFLAKTVDMSNIVRNYYTKAGNLVADYMIREIERIFGITYVNKGEIGYVNDNTGTTAYYSQEAPIDNTTRQYRGAVDASTKGWKDFVLARYSSEEANEIKAALESVASRLGIDPNELAALYSIESGWNKNADNGKYFGLNQMGSNELAMIGLTPSSYKALSAAQQVEVTYTYLKKLGLVGKIKTAGEIYAVTIAQGYFALKAKHGDDYVVYKEGTRAYSLNAAAWNTKEGDGGITIAEIGNALYSHPKTKTFQSTIGPVLPTNQAGVLNAGDDKYGNGRGNSIAEVGMRFMRSGLINTNKGADYWRGFCAAFVNRVLQVTGDVNLFGGSYSTASSVRDKYAARGLLMNKSQAGGYQVGDILFWNRDDANGGHVAIYIGNGMVVQAGNFSDHIETRSVRQTFGASEDVQIFRPGASQSKAIAPVANNLAPVNPPKEERDLTSIYSEIAEGDLGDKFKVSVKETSGGYKFVVKYNTGNGYKIVSDRTVLRTVEQNLERGLAKNNITERSGGGVKYFFVEGSNVDVAKLAGALK